MPTDTVGDVLRAHADSERALLVCDTDRLGYGDAHRRSGEVARGLVALGAGKGTHIGLLYPNGSAFVIGLLAAARIGAVVVPFTTFATAPELRHQLIDADIEIMLRARSFRSHDYDAKIRQVPRDGPVPNLRHVCDIDHVAGRADAVDEALLSAMENDVDGSDVLAIVYTSGSAGAPKGVVHTHDALLGNQRDLNEIRRLSDADTLFCNSPFFWIGGLAFGLLATLVAGSTLVCSNADDPDVTLDLIEAEKPTVTNGFASGIGHLARHRGFAERDVSSMRRGNLYPIMALDTRPVDAELRHNMLGMTEAGSVALISGDESDQPESRRGSFGKPAPGFEIKVVDFASGATVPDGDVGELCLRGRALMLRYHKRSREESFDGDGWFHTGDLVRTDSDGFVYYLGRRTAMIKTAGANVAPAEVEKAIATVLGAVAHVVGLPDRDRGEVVAAVIVGDDTVCTGLDDLRRALATELSSYKLPRRLARLAAADVPLLSSGKVDVNRLKQVFDD